MGLIYSRTLVARKTLVHSLENLALAAFRESGAEFYDPTFIAPGYPQVQVVGVLGGIALLTQMGTIPILGAFSILAGGVTWYWFYGRPRTDRVGALHRIVSAPADGEAGPIEPERG